MKPIKELKKVGKLGMSFQTDASILPEHYMPIKQPYYKGDGEHNVKELQELCKWFTEYCHQQAIIKQTLIEHINNS